MLSVTPILADLTDAGGGLRVRSGRKSDRSARDPRTTIARGDAARLHRARALLETDLAADWAAQFGRWFADAAAAGLPEPNAMIVATADPAGRPSARTVLLKGVRRRAASCSSPTTPRARAPRLAANPYASLVFPWFPMQRQVIVAGTVERVSRAETEEYFATRPRGSQLGAWASPQSRWCPTGPPWTPVWPSAVARFGDGPVPAAAALGRPAGGAGDRRVLAGAEQPAARPAALPAYRRGSLGRRAARAVSQDRSRPPRRSRRRSASPG